MENHKYEFEPSADHLVDETPQMSRREFLTKIGLGSAAVALSACAPAVFAGSSEEVVVESDADIALESESMAIYEGANAYSASGNTWVVIPQETISGVAGQMDAQTAAVFGESLERFLNVTEATAGTSSFTVAEALSNLGINNVDSSFGSINIGSVVRVGDGNPVIEMRDSEGNVVAICETSHFGGIQICAKEGSPLNIRVPSRDGPVPVIKGNSSNSIPTAILQLLKFARYGQNSMNIANGYLAGLGG